MAMKIETDQRVIGFRIKLLVAEAGGMLRADDLCAELRRRGWAFADCCPEAMGLKPDDIIRLRVH